MAEGTLRKRTLSDKRGQHSVQTKALKPSVSFTEALRSDPLDFSSLVSGRVKTEASVQSGEQPRLLLSMCPEQEEDQMLSICGGLSRRGH